MTIQPPIKQITSTPEMDTFHEKAFEVAQKFNDRTLQTIGWIGGTLVVLLVAAAGISAYNLNAEKDRLERAISDFDQRFNRLSAELKGLRLESPKIEIISTFDKLPAAGRLIKHEIFRAENTDEKPYRLKLRFTLKNVGLGSTGRIWMKVYLESNRLFDGDPDTDESAYGKQVVVPHISWGGNYSGFGDMPGAGFSANVNTVLFILEDRIPKGKYKVLLKVYYGVPETKVESVESFFELTEDWVRPKS